MKPHKSLKKLKPSIFILQSQFFIWRLLSLPELRLADNFKKNCKYNSITSKKPSQTECVIWIEFVTGDDKKKIMPTH